MSKIFGLPSSTGLKPRSRVYDLKARLDWGEPALTIIDVRDRSQFHERHITGAINLPAAQVVDLALKTLELDRDLYLYGDVDEDTAGAADRLRAAGYRHVSELQGGLPAWKAMGYPTEGRPIATL